MNKQAYWNRSPRRGISLMEVILALAILGIASAYLAQSMQLAAQNAIRSQRLTQAELVAESVMNQVIAGVIPAQPVNWSPYTSANSSGSWSYMLSITTAELEGMMGIQIAVQESSAGAISDTGQVDLLVTRWIIDPSLGLDTPPVPEETTEESAATGGQSSQGADGQAGQAAGGGMAGGGMAGGGMAGGGMAGGMGGQGGGGQQGGQQGGGRGGGGQQGQGGQQGGRGGQQGQGGQQGGRGGPGQGGGGPGGQPGGRGGRGGPSGGGGFGPGGGGGFGPGGGGGGPGNGGGGNGGFRQGPR